MGKYVQGEYDLNKTEGLDRISRRFVPVRLIANNFYRSWHILKYKPLKSLSVQI
jgi:hypothetical protein